MANRRMIDSSIWEDEFVGELDNFQRVLWIGLFSSCADDQGRLKDNTNLIWSKIFPYDEVNYVEIDRSLNIFSESGKLIRYEKDGKKYIQLLNWWEHQKPQWASKSKFPAPDGWIDRIRTRENNHYIEKNWREQPEQNLPERSPERATCDAQVVGQYPVPVPIPDPVPVNIGAEKTAHPEPTYEPCDDYGEPISTKKPKRSKSDARSKTPAIIAFRRLTGHYPNAVNYQDVIDIVGEKPDEPKLAACYREWCARGYNPKSIKWLTDWYKHGGPPGDKPKTNNLNSAFDRMKEET